VTIEYYTIEAASETNLKRMMARHEEATAVPPPKRRASGTAKRDDAGWDGWLAKLTRYRTAHGHCNIPWQWADDPRLSSWIFRQRQEKRKRDRTEPCNGMTTARVAKLTALGFGWELGARKDIVVWESQLAKLGQYMAAHGDCNVPRGWAEDPRLSNWVSTQRRVKKKLDRGEPSTGMTAARAAKLTALDFAWELSAATISKQNGEGARDDVGWEAHLAKLKAYQRRHGDCNVPRGWAEEPSLGRWVNSQRWHKRRLDRGEPRPQMTAARAAKLTALDFAWELSAATISKQNGKGARDDAGWEAHLTKLKAYKRRHGDCNVPRGWAEEPRLGRWVNRQRAYKKALARGDPRSQITVARVAKLEALGFAWELSTTAKGKLHSNGRRDEAARRSG
jgi:hypothetical protein